MIRRSISEITLYFCLTVLSVFYILSLTSTIISSQKTPQSAELAFILTPFDRFRALDAIRTNSVFTDQKEIKSSLASFFHSHDGEINFALGQFWEKTVNTFTASAYYQKLLPLESQNHAFTMAAFKYFLKSGRTENIRQLIKYMLPQNIQLSQTFTQINLNSDINVSQLDDSIMSKDDKKNISNYTWAKLFYLIGLGSLKVNPEITRNWWKLMIEIYPEQGMLYAELASLEFFIFNNQTEADKIIAVCNLRKIPHLHCKLIKPDFSNLTLPGEITQFIKDAQ